MSKKYALLVLQVGLYVAVIWFVSQRFQELYQSIDFSTVIDKWPLLVLSIGCFLLFYGVLSIHWKEICDKYTKYPQNHQWLSFFASQPYKYLPSSVFTFSSRAVYAKKLGLPIKQSSAVQLIENLDILLSGLCVALLFLGFKASLTAGIITSGLFLVVLCAVTYVPSLKVPKTAINISGREWVRLFSLPVLGWFAAGAAFYFLVMATGAQIDFVTAVSANAIAVSLGILAIFAPGGIGVRELVYDKFNVSNAGIILWRLLTLVIDIVVGALAIYRLNRLSKNP